MIRHRIEELFQPKSLAIVGASDRSGTAGWALTRNVIEGGFAGQLGLVNPRPQSIGGLPVVPRLDALPFAPDVVAIATPVSSVLATARAAADRGAAAAVVVTVDADPARPLAAGLRALAAETGMRVLGPGCLGLISPRAKLNVSLAAGTAAAGDLALLSQSGAVAAALGAWAAARGVGFSGLVSGGAMADIDWASLLDHFATDAATRAILLFLEGVEDVQTFMSAARAAARAKPVIVLRAEGEAVGAAPSTHAAALATPDVVFDAACRRAGLLPVADIDALFEAAEALGRIKPFRGRRLAIVSNGAGLGTLAQTRLHSLGGELAELSAETRATLRENLPPRVSVGNPLDIGGDAEPNRLRAVIETLGQAREVDAILAIHAPTALSKSRDAAQAVADAAAAFRAGRASPKPVFAVWYADEPETDAIFEAARIPHYQRGAVGGFMHLVRWMDAREFLTSVPPSLPAEARPDPEAMRALVETALGGAAPGDRRRLSADAASRLLDAYGIPIAPARHASSPEEAAELARLFIARAGACVVKIASPDIADKTALGGIALDLRTPRAVAAAAAGILKRIAIARPDARIEGVTVHPLIQKPDARELLVGLADDAVFGPTIVFGRGGKAVEVVADCAVALPPLDLSLARDLISRTRIARTLAEYRDVRSVDLDEVALILVKLGQLAADVPAVREIDLNPLLADPSGLVAVDCRVVVAREPRQQPGVANPRFAVAPYPAEQEQHFALPDGTRVFVRPVRPEDEGMYRAFFSDIPAEDLRLRFFGPMHDFSHAFLARLTQVDYARVYAVAAFDERTGAMIGGVRLVGDADRVGGEYAILIAPALKGRGLGRALMEGMIAAARTFGLEKVDGFVLAENDGMLRLARALGFSLRNDPYERGVVRTTLSLR